MVSRVRKLAKLATKKKQLDSKFLLDSSYVASIAANEARDSNDAKNIVDSDHVFLKQNKSFSSIILILKSCAFDNFDPGFFPTITALVLEETEELTVAPNFSNRSFRSLRDKLSKDPVITTL